MSRAEATDLQIGDVFTDASDAQWQVLDTGRFMYIQGRREAAQVPAYISDTHLEYCIDTTDLPFCFFIGGRRAYMARAFSTQGTPVIMWAVLLKADEREMFATIKKEMI